MESLNSRVTRCAGWAFVVLVLMSVADGQESKLTQQFKDAAGKQRFDEGQRQFASGSYSAARKSFKAAKRTATKSGAPVVKEWIRACKGGEKLAAAEKLATKGRFQQAWAKLLKVEKDYGDSPLETTLAQTKKNLSERMFSVINDFESGKKFDIAYGQYAAEFCNHKERVQAGARSLLWKPTGEWVDLLPIGDLDPDTLYDFPILSFWVHTEDKALRKFFVLLATNEMPRARSDPRDILGGTFYYEVTLEKAGWHEIRLEVPKSFASNSKLDFESISTLALAVTAPSKPKPLVVDSFVLQRR